MWLSLTIASAQRSQTAYTMAVRSSGDIAMLQYTGGTTGLAKGAMLSHGNLVANAMQLDGFFETHNIESEGAVFMQPLPVYHIYAFTASMFSSSQRRTYLVHPESK